jgi:hypothetical protein
MMKIGEPEKRVNNRMEGAYSDLLTWDFSCHSVIRIGELFGTLNLPDTLPSTTFASLDHDRPTDFDGLL